MTFLHRTSIISLTTLLLVSCPKPPTDTHLYDTIDPKDVIWLNTQTHPTPTPPTHTPTPRPAATPTPTLKQAVHTTIMLWQHYYAIKETNGSPEDLRALYDRVHQIEQLFHTVYADDIRRIQIYRQQHPTPTPKPRRPTPPATTIQPTPTPLPPGCETYKTCTEIATCTDARYRLTTCGHTDLDRDDDGIPCEDTLCTP